MNDDEKNNKHAIGSSSSSTGNNMGTTVAATTTTTWLRQKDPRIVRVCKALGGKDRHSKVCTIRGLRDRRVRLSVPTAIQLYDLQDRLGLNQPSKVVDWLLNAAKSEIDGLPPLPISPSEFCPNPNNTNTGTMINWADISRQQQQQLWWNSSTAGTGTTASTSTDTGATLLTTATRGGAMEEEEKDGDDDDNRGVNEVLHGQGPYGLVLQAHQDQNPNNNISTMFNLGSGHHQRFGLSQTKDDDHHNQQYHHHHHQQQQLHHHHHHQSVNMEMSPLSLSNTYNYPPPHLAAASAAAGDKEVGPTVRFGDHSNNQMLMMSSSSSAAAAAAYFNVDNRSSQVIPNFHQLTELSMMSSRFSHSHHWQPPSSTTGDDHHRRGGGQEFQPSPR